MIDTLFFLLQIIGVIVLIGWAVLNDQLKVGALIRGPLAFKQDPATLGERSRRRKGGGGLTRHRTGLNLENQSD